MSKKETETGGIGTVNDSLLPTPKPRYVNPLITGGHLSRKAIVYIRQSSMKQKEENVGSTEYQRQLKQVAASMGWPEHLIEINEKDLGISSRATEQRTDWRQILKEISEDLVGAVFIVNSSRMARQYEYYADFRKLAARHNVLIFMDGRLINLRDLGDTLYSNMSAFVAEISSLIQTEHMRKSRLAKAQTGKAVSALPVGWIKRPDNTFDFDPVAKPAIDMVISTFRRIRSLHGTVKALVDSQTRLPAREKKVTEPSQLATSTQQSRIKWVKPSLDRVKNIVVHPAYSGVYIYAKTESAPELGLQPNGRAMRKPKPAEDWITTLDHHPAYISAEEQQEFRKILLSKSFSQRHRPGRGRALLQGIVECGRCGSRLLVGYSSKHGPFSYRCVQNHVRFAERACLTIAGQVLDSIVERELLSVLETPPIETLKDALEEDKQADQIHLDQLVAEQERLQHRVRVARQHFENCDPHYNRVFVDSQRQLEMALADLESFRKRISSDELKHTQFETEDDLQELCSLAQEVPTLWHNPLVTNDEKKELLRCHIEKIVITPPTGDVVNWTIHWKGCPETFHRYYRRAGYKRLVQELHSQGYSVHEIRQRLADGQTSTRQSWDVSVDSLYSIMKRLGLRPHTFSSEFRAAKKLAQVLYEHKLSLQNIAEELNRQGYRTLFGKEFKSKSAFRLLTKIPRRTHNADLVSRQVFSELENSGLTCRQIAAELNRRGIPRQLSAHPWTTLAVKQRRAALRHKVHRLEDFVTPQMPRTPKL